MQIDTDTARRALGLGASTAREVLAIVAARTGRSDSRASGKRRARTVAAADLAAHYGLTAEDIALAASLAA